MYAPWWRFNLLLDNIAALLNLLEVPSQRVTARCLHNATRFASQGGLFLLIL